MEFIAQQLHGLRKARELSRVELLEFYFSREYQEAWKLA